ncbi:MAG: capsule assembly Wzi family protein [Kangiellaceae bacterium]|nr:capsule assembly Wzi family protein [Kangiellaceae bacterium]
MRIAKTILILILSLNINYLLAGGVSTYLPIGLSPTLENEIERLASIAGVDSLIKPYPVNRILNALETVKVSHPKLYRRLNSALKPYTQKRSITHASARISASGDHHAQPNARGSYTNSHASVDLRGQWLVSPWLAVSLGANSVNYSSGNIDDIYQTSGSLLSLGVDWAQLDIGYKDFWLSPFQGSAQLLSTQAQTMPSISLSNNSAIETFGVKWNYLGFLSQMSRQGVQSSAGIFSDRKKPLLAGLHLSFQATDWWSIGGTRVFQFGGGERSTSFSTLVRAFVDPRGADNDASIEDESGNQIASINSKMNFDGSIPITFSLELAGEDTSNNKAYQLGNTSVTTGIYFPYIFSDNISLTYEYSDWQEQWYVNNVFAKGYINKGFVLGSWAMQLQREAGTATSGTSHYFKTHWQRENAHVIAASLRLSENEDTATVDYSTGWEFQLDYIVPWQGHLITFAAFVGRDSLDQSFSQLSVSLEY